MRTTRSTKNKEKNSTFRSFERPLSSIETKKNRKKPCFLGSASRSARRARPWTAWAAASAGPKCTSKRVRRNLDVEEEKKRRELISAAPAPALPPSRELLPPPSSLSPSDQLAFPLFPTTSTPLQPHRRPLRSRIKIKPPSKTPSISLPPPHLSARRLFDALVGRGRIRRSVGDGGGRRPLGGQVQRVVWGGHQRYVESLVLSGDDESGEREKKKNKQKKKKQGPSGDQRSTSTLFSLSLSYASPLASHTHTNKTPSRRRRPRHHRRGHQHPRRRHRPNDPGGHRGFFELKQRPGIAADDARRPGHHRPQRLDRRRRRRRRRGARRHGGLARGRVARRGAGDGRGRGRGRRGRGRPLGRAVGRRARSQAQGAQAGGGFFPAREREQVRGAGRGLRQGGARGLKIGLFIFCFCLCVNGRDRRVEEGESLGIRKNRSERF